MCTIPMIQTAHIIRNISHVLDVPSKGSVRPLRDLVSNPKSSMLAVAFSIDPESNALRHSGSTHNIMRHAHTETRSRKAQAWRKTLGY